MRPEPTSKWCGAEASVGVLGPDSLAVRSSVARLLRLIIGTAMVTPITVVTPITDPTMATDLRTITTILAEAIGMIGSSVVAFDLAPERCRKRT